MTEPRWTPNPGRRPRTGEKLLRIKWANGEESKHEFRADQLRWTITGHPFDVAECAQVSATPKAKDGAWTPVSGGY